MSEETKKGLAECEYEVPTEIQKETLTLGLRGLDILGKIKSFDVTYFINPQSQVLILDLWQVASSGFFLPKIVPKERILWKTVTNYRHVWLNTAKYG